MTVRRIACTFRPNIRRPLFVVGSPRSGTTFLGACLGRLPELSYHNEPAATMRACPLIHGGAWSPARGKRFYRSVTRWLMRLHLEGDLRFADKCPRHAMMIPFLRQTFADAQFVHLIRDGRDVATSLAEKQWLNLEPATGTAGTSPRKPANPARSFFWVETDRVDEFENTTVIHRCIWGWRRFTETALADLADLPGADHHELRYEDLARQPAREADRLLEFLNIGDSDSRAALHEALREVKTSSIGRWKAALTHEQLEQIHSEAGPLLDRLGYMEDDC